MPSPPFLLSSLLVFFGLWGPEVERDIIRKLGAKAYTTIECPKDKGGCGQFREKAVFSDQSKCPHCKAALVVQVPNARNAPLSVMTEDFARQALQEAIDKHFKGTLFVERGVVCDELSLTEGSAADIAILRKKGKDNVKPEDFVAVIEVKMSLIWNWKEGEDKPCADYDAHGGRPSLFRTDSLLKAIGKSAIFRSTPGSRNIPFLIIGNCPPPKGYHAKIDGAVRLGLVQKFLSLTPHPLHVNTAHAENRNLKQTPGRGFLRIDSTDELADFLKQLLETEWVHLGGMADRKSLGQILKGLDTAKPEDEIVDRFLQQLGQEP